MSCGITAALWIICVTEFRGWRHPVAAPGRWTPVFFLDEAVGLAAGHRPCGLCRREAYRSYRDAVSASIGSSRPLKAIELNDRLNHERLRRGRGIDRAGDRILWSAEISEIPAGSVIVDIDHTPKLVLEDRLMEFSHGGWRAPRRRPDGGMVEVLTPPTSVAALSNGFQPSLHPSVAPGGHQ